MRTVDGVRIVRIGLISDNMDLCSVNLINVIKVFVGDFSIRQEVLDLIS